MFKINTTLLPTPSEFSLTTRKRMGTVRSNLLGQTVLDGVCDKRRFTLVWRRLTEAQQSTLSGALSGETFTLSYPAPNGTQSTATCYASSFYHQCLRSGTDTLYANIRLELEEC